MGDDFQVAGQEGANPLREKRAAQVLSRVHRHGVAAVDGQRIQRRGRVAGREAGEPVILAAVRSVDLLNSGGRVGPDVV